MNGKSINIQCYRIYKPMEAVCQLIITQRTNEYSPYINAMNIRYDDVTIY